MKDKKTRPSNLFLVSQTFNEFHPFLDEETRRKQGARCMNCGVPLSVSY